MYVVYYYNQETQSWDYQCTLLDTPDLIYCILQLYDEIEHNSDQSILLEELIENKRYVGRYLRIYYVGSPAFMWG